MAQSTLHELLSPYELIDGDLTVSQLAHLFGGAAEWWIFQLANGLVVTVCRPDGPRSVKARVEMPLSHMTYPEALRRFAAYIEES
jgi:hypothetical protein